MLRRRCRRLKRELVPNRISAKVLDVSYTRRRRRRGVDQVLFASISNNYKKSRPDCTKYTNKHGQPPASFERHCMPAVRVPAAPILREPAIFTIPSTCDDTSLPCREHDTADYFLNIEERESYQRIAVPKQRWNWPGSAGRSTGGVQGQDHSDEETRQQEPVVGSRARRCYDR